MIYKTLLYEDEFAKVLKWDLRLLNSVIDSLIDKDAILIEYCENKEKYLCFRSMTKEEKFDVEYHGTPYTELFSDNEKEFLDVLYWTTLLPDNLYSGKFN